MFLALKSAICEKFRNYLYGSKVLTDNNLLTYLLIDNNRTKCWYINNVLFSLPVGGNYIVYIICRSESAVV